MKLTDCDATFWTHRADRRGMGVSLDCPLCIKAGLPPERRDVLVVPFTNPLDGGPPEPSARSTWARSGTTLEDLTLDPSLDDSGEMHDHGPGWHGLVVKGEIVGGGI